MRILIIAMLIVTTISFSNTVTQTDWSGGAGVQGPVMNWGETFYSTDGNLSVISEVLKLAVQLIVPVEHTVDGEFDYAYSVYAADIDGDGDADILGAALGAMEGIAWWENTDGTGTSWTEHTVDEEFGDAYSVHATDVDDDGDMDVLGASNSAHDITWWENTNGMGTIWTEHTIDENYDHALDVHAADIDGDGDVDVLGASNGADDITWWENTNGTGTSWTKHTIDGNFDCAYSVHATDVNGDGDIDVLGAALIADNISWWENTDGTGTLWSKHTIDGNADGARDVYSADVDGDGDTDVLGAIRYDDDITWWENSNGTGTSWTEHTIDGSFDAARSVYSADVDGDGDMDVLGAAVNADDITWWENTNGTGTSWTEHIVDGDFDGANSVYSADIDSDGFMDILGAASHDNDIAWWKVSGYTSVGTLESSILDAGTVDSWDTFAFNHLEPSGTSVGYQFRSSQDSSNMGVWSDTVFTSTSLSGILADSTDFLQYKVILQTADPQITPVLEDLSFIYSTYGTATEETNTAEILFWGLTPVANPSFGSLAIQVSSPHQAMVDIMLHDITGRVIARQQQELPEGTNSVSLGNLAEGVYFCTMHAENFTTTERVVVLK